MSNSERGVAFSAEGFLYVFDGKGILHLSNVETENYEFICIGVGKKVIGFGECVRQRS